MEELPVVAEVAAQPGAVVEEEESAAPEAGAAEWVAQEEAVVAEAGQAARSSRWPLMGFRTRRA